jgi:hypothetical protein
MEARSGCGDVLTGWQAVGPGAQRPLRTSRRKCALAAAAAISGTALLVSTTSRSFYSVLAAGSWSADHSTITARLKMASLAGLAKPPLPTLPSGWQGTWDAQAHRYYYFKAGTNEVTWDLPHVVPARTEPSLHANHHKQHYKNAGWKLTPGAVDTSDTAERVLAGGNHVSGDVRDVTEYWQKRGKDEMQQAKNSAWEAAVEENYDNYDVKKGRAMHKLFHGKVGGGEGYWPVEPPSYPKPGEVPHQGLSPAIEENYDEYDMSHGIAIHKIYTDDSYLRGQEGDSMDWDTHWGDHPYT